MSNKHPSNRAGRALGIAIVAALGVGFAASASAQIVAKQLAGPASEFASMRTPDPVDATIHSHSALLPVAMFATKSGMRGQSALPVENGKLRFALLVPEDAAVEVTLNGPRGQKLRGSEGAKAGAASSFGIEEAQVPARLYGFENVAKGMWSIELTSKARLATPGYVLLEGDDRTELASYATHSRQIIGETLGLTAQLTGVDAQGKAILGPGAGRIDRATLNVTGPDGRSESFAMFDDGQHDDGAAGDGLFGAAFTARLAGDHVAQVAIEGVDQAGNRVLRTAEHLLPFVDRSITLAGDRASASHDKSGATRLSIEVPVSAAKGLDHYLGFAEVWGRDSAGNALPVAWVSGMVTPRDGRLGFGFDERWIAKANAQGPFELRNLRIEHPDNFVTIAAAERMSLEMPRLRIRVKASEIVVDESMTMGPRPAQQAGAKGVGKRLLLVHGYCSAGVWPASQFSTASSFLDKNQNRSHDAFARLIQSFGNTWNSYGIVAHSQGGAAALHLYTYYWSGLDNATGARLIQSVGTPYKGTNLAGILATLGNWFGVGCGNNSNLNYSGASTWLAGIPNSSRAKVNYYTTSFKSTNWWTNDYCNMATDLVLSDPEDGTTEKVNGQLPGAINRGHATGQCHTANMRDPAQYLNSARNATMNSNAAR